MKTPIAATLILAVLFASTASSQDSCPGGAAEGPLNREARNVFVRRGPRLVIKFDNGRSQSYTDRVPKKVEDSGKIICYEFAEYYRDVHYGLIKISYYEGGSRILLNLRTGIETAVEGIPVLSPNRMRFAVANADVESHYTSNELAVYRIGPAGLVAEFVASPKDWGADELRWRTDDELSFNQSRFDSKSLAAVNTQKTLKRRGARWVIE